MNTSSQNLEQVLTKTVELNDPNELAVGFSVLVKMLNNICMNPLDDKYRHLKLSNSTLKAKIYNLKLIDDLLKLLGFTKNDDEYYLQDDELGRLICGLNALKRTDMLVQAVIISEEEYKKAKQIVARQLELEHKQELDQIRKQEALAQAHSDRQENKFNQSKDSVAKDAKFGATVKKCEDMGINTKQQGGTRDALGSFVSQSRCYSPIKKG